jgi:beta-glucosidase
MNLASHYSKGCLLRSFLSLSRAILTVSLVFAVVVPLKASGRIENQPPAEKKEAYRDSKLPVDVRVQDLLARMTLQEKVGQMCQYNGGGPDEEQLARSGLVGSFLNVTSPEEINKLQKAAVEESRLGIPILFGLDVIHGFSTIFPIPLAEASTWNPDIVKTCASVAAKEAFSQGIRWTFAPMVDIARDPRWGRIAEGAGEDPFLGMAMASAQVKGFQGSELDSESHVVACAKHFVAYGAAEGGRDYNTAEVSERTLREVYLPPFKAAVDAGVGSIMSAFDDLDGVPATANPFTLREILKGEWAFKGFVVSDWDAVGELINHGIACDSSEAAEKAVNAGVDMDMVGPYHAELAKLVEEGKVPAEVVDEAVRRILTIKFELGLFEHPYTDIEKSKGALLLPEYRKIAAEEARESIVLLKNEGNILPLSKRIGSIAVIGPLGDSKEDMLGPWHCLGKPDPVVTMLAGIRAEVGESAKIYYAEGCGVNDTSTSGFVKALKVARGADAIIVAVGERGNMSGEAESRSSLNLPGVQEQLLKELVALGKPVVEVLMNGRPLSIEWSADHVPAILETWFPGTEGGSAIADVLFGNYNPSGKLPVTFPRTVGQVPIYYNHMSTGRPPSATDHFTSKYIDLPSTPLFPFGYGLSYTKFDYSDFNVSADPGVKDQFLVTVDVTNSGKRSGTETAQLYVRQRCTSVTRPVEQLAGFKRVELAPGETKTISFVLTPYDISFINAKMQRVVESGDLDVMVGGNSVDLLSKTVDVEKSMQVGDRVPVF